MLGQLPKSIKIGSKWFDIDTDYRTALTIFQAYNDDDYTLDEQSEIMLRLLIKDYDKLQRSDLNDAITECCKYLDCGEIPQDTSNRKKSKISSPKLMDWEQDEQLIFSAVNKVAGKEIRELPYMHWWTFIGYFKERGECMLNAIISIRDKRNKHQKLSKEEQEFYENNKNMIDLTRMATDEKEEIERLRRIARGQS